jgi:hypothetical protein
LLKIINKDSLINLCKIVFYRFVATVNISN